MTTMIRWVALLGLWAAGCAGAEPGERLGEPAVTTLAATNLPALPQIPAGGWQIIFNDVGTGLSMVLRNASGVVLVYDAGSNDPEERGPVGRALPSYRIRDFMKAYGLKKIRYLVMSHPHSDHEAFMDVMFDEFSVEHFFDPGLGSDDATGVTKKEAYDTQFYHCLIKKVAERVKAKAMTYHTTELCPGQNPKKELDFRSKCRADPPAKYSIPAELLEEGEVLKFDRSVKVKFLRVDGTDQKDPNENSLVLLITFKNNGKLLLTGDSNGTTKEAWPTLKNGTTEDYLLRTYAADITGVDVLQVSHHGSKTSSSGRFLDRVLRDRRTHGDAASYAILSSGPKVYDHHNRKWLPDEEVVQDLIKRLGTKKNDGSRLFRTDANDRNSKEKLKCWSVPRLPDGTERHVGPAGSDSGCNNIVINVDADGAIQTPVYWPLAPGDA